MTTPLLSVRGLSKSFGATAALSAVDLDFYGGEVHALVGENGAGKSTLCRIIAGLQSRDAGAITLQGAPYSPASRKEAQHLGVRMVMQELNLLPSLTVAENLFFDSLPRRAGMIRYRQLNELAREAMASVGLTTISPRQPLGSLGIGQCQLVEIAAALSRRCEVLILDEPTAALTSAEIELLFAQVRRLREAGAAIIYVSHRMEEIRRISDRITILRDGRHIATLPTAQTTHDQIVRMMVGRDLPASAQQSTAQARSTPLLGVRNLWRPPAIRDISFDLHPGEILGLAGLMGSGRTETLRAIFGADRALAGSISIQGREVPVRSPRQAVKNGIALVTEDRKSQGLLLPASIRSNISLAGLGLLSRWGWIRTSDETATALRFIDSLSIRCRSPHQPAAQLSGGNQQKVVLSKWLFRDSDILLLDEPTRGIDIGAKFEIYQLLRELASKGKGILLVSSELSELLLLCDRIAVLSAGRLVQTFEPPFSQDQVMNAALSGYAKAHAAP